jgi:hypothetical protein
MSPRAAGRPSHLARAFRLADVAKQRNLDIVLQERDGTIHRW